MEGSEIGIFIAWAIKYRILVASKDLKWIAPIDWVCNFKEIRIAGMGGDSIDYLVSIIGENCVSWFVRSEVVLHGDHKFSERSH